MSILVDMQEWRDIGGWEGIYEVSNLGLVRNRLTGNILKPHLHHSGYYNIALKSRYVNGRKPTYASLARLIALAWIPNPHGKKEVNHKNGVKTDDSICNLEWVTPSENIVHYYYKLNKGVKRKVIQMDMDGNAIQEFESVSMASRSVGGRRGGNIVSACRGRLAYAHGYKWKYA